MPGINFPALFGQVIGEAYAKMFNLVAQQEVEREGYANLIGALKRHNVELSQVEINEQTGEVRVVPVVTPPSVTLTDASLDDLTQEMARRATTLYEAKQDAVEDAIADPEEIEAPPVGHHEPEPPMEQDLIDPETIGNVNWQKPNSSPEPTNDA